MTFNNLHVKNGTKNQWNLPLALNISVARSARVGKNRFLFVQVTEYSRSNSASTDVRKNQRTPSIKNVRVLTRNCCPSSAAMVKPQCLTRATLTEGACSVVCFFLFLDILENRRETCEAKKNKIVTPESFCEHCNSENNLDASYAAYPRILKCIVHAQSKGLRGFQKFSCLWCVKEKARN